MPTSSPPPKVAGFTLIELLVVIAIIALVAIAMVPNIGRKPAGLTRQSDVASILTTIARARQLARSTGTPQQLDPAKLVTDGHLLDAPFASQDMIIFYPDGSASGGTLAAGERALLHIDWLTGVAHAPQ